VGSERLPTVSRHLLVRSFSFGNGLCSAPASLKTELKITEAQMPAWNKFADALLAVAKSMDESMDAMHKKMMEPGAVPSLPDKLQHHAKMAAVHLANLNAIKAALDPLYASFSDDQKKLADRLRIGPMGVM
jgi:LTXXQ motif family protein